MRSSRIVGTVITSSSTMTFVRRFLKVVGAAMLFSVVLGYCIALVYVTGLNIEAVQQPPFPDPTQAERDATAQLLPSSPNG